MPYVIAVVFTLVAEQIDRHARTLRKESLGAGSTRGQGAAIAAATAAILLGGAILYGITPQVTWPYLSWKYGQPGNLGILGKTPGPSQVGQNADGAGSGGKPEEGDGKPLLPKSRWPSPGDMRAAAERKGMPQWQASAMRAMADMVELGQGTLTPIKLCLDELWRDIKEWLQRNRQTIVQSLLFLIALALLVAAWLLLREARLGLWLRTRFDYLRLGLLPCPSPRRATPGPSSITAPSCDWRTRRACRGRRTPMRANIWKPSAAIATTCATRPRK